MKKLNLKNTLFATSIVAAGVIGASAAHAALLQGTTGATSNGTFDVQLIIENKLKISDLVKIDMGTFGGGNMSNSADFCAFFNQGNSASYQLTLDGTNVPGSFVLEVGGNSIPYSLDIDDNNGTTSAVTATTPITGLSVGAAFATNDDCDSDLGAGVGNLTVTASALATDITTAGANGTYTDEVSILIAPNF